MRRRPECCLFLNGAKPFIHQSCHGRCECHGGAFCRGTKVAEHFENRVEAACKLGA